MLQGRLFAYGDGQHYRLGVNHHQIPVSSPKKAAANPSHRARQMSVDVNAGATIGYQPNSFGEWQQQPEYKDPSLDLIGAADNWNFREDDSDYYTQPGKLVCLTNEAQRQVLFQNTARAMGDAPEFIKLRHIESCRKADPAYREGVTAALGISVEKA